jgi:2-oxoglutarate dehydrogenase E2 component (dihydrolipoamide succinyltransferase)
MAQKIVLPEMGEGVIEGTLSRWLVREGDRVEKYAPIAEVETDKVTTETTAEVGGTVLKLCVGEGETIPVGTVLAWIGEAGERVGDGDEPEATAERAQPAAVRDRTSLLPPAPVAVDHPEPAAVYAGRISPVVGRIAAEHGVDLSLVHGTGRDGRVTKQDVLAYVEARSKAVEDSDRQAPDRQARDEWPAADRPIGDDMRVPVREEDERRPAISAPAASSPSVPAGDVLAMTSMRRTIAEHMVHSKRTSPHVTTVFEFDFSAVSAHRKAHKDQFSRDGANLTFTAYIVAATVEALKAHPMANSSWSDAGIVLRREINIGMATALDEGLIVPVIKNADGMNLLGLARAINDLASRARAKQLKPAEVQGGTFSITNHGTSGSLFATPIINQPQCGILGVGKIEKRVKVIDDAIAIRPVAYVSFTFDHRILDGASADAFVSTIKDVIEGWR